MQTRGPNGTTIQGCHSDTNRSSWIEKISVCFIPSLGEWNGLEKIEQGDFYETD